METKRKTVALVHTSSSLAPVFENLCKEKNLDVNLVHIEDASLIRDMVAAGELTADMSQRVLDHVTAAEGSADCIMVTCSSLGPAVDAAQSRMSKPLLRVDQPLADQAVLMGNRIGVVATLVTTLVPTTELIQRRAEKAGKKVEVISELCEGTFEALANGDFEKHDATIVAAIERLAKEVDVVVLAQASMARVIGKLNAEEIGVPILSSPSLAVDYLVSVL